MCGFLPAIRWRTPSECMQGELAAWEGDLIALGVYESSIEKDGETPAPCVAASVQNRTRVLPFACLDRSHTHTQSAGGSETHTHTGPRFSSPSIRYSPKLRHDACVCCCIQLRCR